MTVTHFQILSAGCKSFHESTLPSSEKKAQKPINILNVPSQHPLLSFQLPSVQLKDSSQISTQKLDTLAVLPHAKLYSCSLSCEIQRKQNGSVIYSQSRLLYQRKQLSFFLS